MRWTRYAEIKVQGFVNTENLGGRLPLSLIGGINTGSVHPVLQDEQLLAKATSSARYTFAYLSYNDLFGTYRFRFT